MSKDLAGRVVLVTGASKGIGRGIAVELGARGAVTFVTARTLGDGPSGIGLRATVAAIEEEGGSAVALRCDHSVDADVAAVFKEIEAAHGRLDILVNNASADYSSQVGKKFWEIPTELYDTTLAVGPRSAFVASALAAPIMIRQGGGLIANISSHGSLDYILSTPYGAAKAALDKLSADMGAELQEHGVAVVSLWPGLAKSERIVDRAVESEEGGLEVDGLNLTIGESPRFTGRAVAALALDPDVIRRTGNAYRPSELAREYGFTDVDGTLPPVVLNLADYIGEENIPPFWRIVEPYPPRVPTGDGRLTLAEVPAS